MWLSGSSVGNTAGSISSREIGSTLELLETSFFFLFVAGPFFFFFTDFFWIVLALLRRPLFSAPCAPKTRSGVVGLQ